MKYILSTFLILISLNAKAVPEIPDPNLSDIALATHINGQIVIVYNPYVCDQMGPLVCGFFRAHEYGHVNLGHILKNTHPAQAEYEADCWAANNAPYPEVEAAYYHFQNQGYMGSWSHGSGFQRAQRLKKCM